MGSNDTPVRLDLNNPVFQEHLLNLQKPERNAAIDTLRKIRLLTWAQLYRDNGLKWEKIVSALMASPNSPTRGHPKFPQAAPSDYDVSGWITKRAAASLSL